MRTIQTITAAILVLASSMSYGQISVEQCLSNLNADLKVAVKATNDPADGIKVMDFSYGAVENNGEGLQVQYIIKLARKTSDQVSVGTVALAEDCKIAGAEKFAGLTYTPIYMKLK